MSWLRLNDTIGDHPKLLRKLKNLFDFYLTNSRNFGCSDSLMKLVSKVNARSKPRRLDTLEKFVFAGTGGITGSS